MSRPASTYRLQLHKGFGFDRARAVLPYLKRLGISHLYLSPITTAVLGSVHGYDVTDYAQINPELGGEGGFLALVAQVRKLGLGIILDFVPNHMSTATPDNAWWSDVLANGEQSVHARVFDVDWESARNGMSGKILLPILGHSYAEALESGAVTLAFDSQTQRFEIRYYQHRLPISPGSDPRRTPASDEARQNDEQRRVVPEEQLCALVVPVARGEGPNHVVSAILHEYDAASPQGRARLHTLLEAQHYRLCDWKLARDALNWRRFFEISDLVGVRAEDPEVFDATHAMVLDLYARGLIDGLRIDHVDGLADPAGYCRRLRARLDSLLPERPSPYDAEPAYLVVEKILAPFEDLPPDWPVDGTTGYDFLNQVLGVLLDGAGEEPLTAIWHTASGSWASFDTIESEARRQILDQNLHSELARATARFLSVAQHEIAARDLSEAVLLRACRALLIELRVYRTYGYGREAAPGAHPHLLAAFRAASRTVGPADLGALESIERWLKGEFGPEVPDALAREATARFAQLAAPLAAKAVEDTAFYRYGRLIACNEVGGSGTRFALSPQGFHASMEKRARHWPNGLNATATHDHKRGEDLRARLAVLSEEPGLWQEAVADWHSRARPYRTVVEGVEAPDGGDEIMLYQMLVGAWPPTLTLADEPGIELFMARIARWTQKALREAKRHSSWLAPNEAYESACLRFLECLKDGQNGRVGLADIAGLARRIEIAGALNGLTQSFLRMTAPGIPDLYQGCERWDFSLVDPDNRPEIDYPDRVLTLGEPSDWPNLLGQWRNGHVKEILIARTLAARQQALPAFARGEYRAIEALGPRASSLLAFERVLPDEVIVCVATRLAFPLLVDRPHVPAALWGATRLLLGPGRPTRWTDLITGEEIEIVGGELAASDGLKVLPVCLLAPRA
jgi:(1->4)-alpha-D-glucan 1-alpha-D-glucosylmutase